MQLGNFTIENPLALGPMAGVTDWAFRTICAEMGANITVTEMVSSRALVYKDKKSKRRTGEQNTNKNRTKNLQKLQKNISNNPKRTTN